MMGVTAGGTTSFGEVAYERISYFRRSVLESSLLRQVRVLQGLVCVLVVTTGFLCVNLVHPFLRASAVKVLRAERVEIRERDGTVKAVLSNSAGWEGERTKEGVRFSGLMFYNEEGQETGGLIYQGKAIPGGQDSDVTLTMDQYRQDQNVYLNHTEHVDARGRDLSDGLTILSRPDWTKLKDEFATGKVVAALPASEQDAARMAATEAGKLSTRRLFLGAKRGVKEQRPFDDAGLFIKNRLGRDAIRLYVDYDNRPHFEVYDRLGKSVVYELKLP